MPLDSLLTLDSALYALHVLSALVWVGGMFFAWIILRPAAVSALQGPARLTLWLEVFRRFFQWVWLTIVLLPLSGVAMLESRFAGFAGAPKSVQVMMGLYIAMLALFLRVQLLQLPQLRQAVSNEDWPAGANALGKIRRLVGFNLLLGLSLVAIAAARPNF
ncbi:MAG: CopD family protein [Pseudomonadaceae bacterium]|nr:CopD family protein [Pseudomonadaceae bacterium]